MGSCITFCDDDSLSTPLVDDVLEQVNSRAKGLHDELLAATAGTVGI